MSRKPAGRAWVILGGAAVYALLFALGSQIDQTGTTAWGTSLLRFGYALPIAAAILVLLFRYVFPGIVRLQGSKQKPFCTAGAWCLIFLCYVPVFLVMYPGSFTYDSMTQIHQIAGSQYNTHHPLLHTLLIGACLSLYESIQSIELCGAIYSLAQMMLMAGCFALVCASISRSISCRAANVSLVFFCIYPAHMAFASNCTKDALFSAFLALFFALGFELLTDGNERSRWLQGRKLLWYVSGILACMLRNNMVYAMVGWLVILLVAGRKSYRRHLLCAIMVVCVSWGMNGTLKAITNAEDGPIKEMLSVPVQQLVRARLHAPECFDEEEKAQMDTLFLTNGEEVNAFYRRYEPTLSDPMKDALDNERVKACFPEYVRLWAQIGKKCPGIYLDAFLHLAHTSFYPYSTYRVARGYIDVGSGRALTAPYCLPPLTPPARFDSIRAKLVEIYANGADNIPVIRYFFNSGLIYWVMFAFVLYDLYCGRWNRVILCLLPVLLWGTYLLGPVMYGRYLYPFICCLPLFVFRTEK